MYILYIFLDLYSLTRKGRFTMLGLTFFVTVVFPIVTASHNLSRCIGDLDLAFLIDASGSVGYQRFEKVTTFLQRFLSNAEIADDSIRVGAITWSKEASVEFTLDQYIDRPDPPASISSHIGSLTYTRGYSNTAAALRSAREVLFSPTNGERLDVPDLVVIITEGESNSDKRLTIPEAEKLKQDGIYILGIAIQNPSDGPNEELKKIVSDPKEIISLQSYDDLDELAETIFQTMCPVLDRCSCVRRGRTCPTEGKVVERCCRRFKCLLGKWQLEGFKGCPRRGKCYVWDETWEKMCTTYECLKKGTCDGDLCPQFEIVEKNKDCCVDGKCIKNGDVVPDDKKCKIYKCIDGVYELFQQECRDCEGVCRPIGYQYVEKCITFECQAVGQRVRFRPVETGCMYQESCISLGTIITEGCDELVCTYDDVSKEYDLVIQTRGCDDDGTCKKVGDRWQDEDTCTKFACVYNEKKDQTVIRQRIKGCRDDDICVPKGDSVEKDCYQYTCAKNGSLVLDTAGCEFNGQCKSIGSSWKVEADCAIYKCKFDVASDGTVQTYTEKTKGCSDFSGNCIYPGRTFEYQCKTYKCTTCGSIIVDKQACQYSSKCYNVDETWFDDTTCEELTCTYDPASGTDVVSTRTGCIDPVDNKCYRTNSFKKETGSCVKYKCHSDGELRQHVCEFNLQCYAVGDTWIDNRDCLKLSCVKDIDGSVYIEDAPYGCKRGNKCNAPGHTYKESCQTYKCKGAGLSYEQVGFACEDGDRCRRINETWVDNDRCKEYGCYEDVDSVEIDEIEIGCKDGGTCVMKSKTEGCIQYTCNGGVMTTTTLGCEYRGRCINVGESVFNKRKCVEYKCVSRPTSSDSAAVRLIEKWGCIENDCCYRRGEKKIDDCVKYVCRAKKFQIVKAECEWRGKCYTVGAEWDHPKKCLKLSCYLDPDDGLAKIKREKTGCKDENGNCQPYGTTKQISQCVTAVCEDRDDCSEFFPTDAACEVGTECKPIDSTWIDQDKCVKKICKYKRGTKTPVIRRIPYGCFDDLSICRPFGYIQQDPENPCIDLECSVYEQFTPIKLACSWEGKCYNPKETWEDSTTCTKYRCRKINLGGDKIKMKVVKIQGCVGTGGECYADGEVITRGCDQYQCDPMCGGLIPLSEQCRYKGECKPVNSTWFDPDTCTEYMCVYNYITKEVFIKEKQKGCDLGSECLARGMRKKEDCNKFVCTAKSDLKPVKTGCDDDGVCRAVGETWEKGCIKYTCVLVSASSSYVETRIDEEHGCIDRNTGKCYHVGESFKCECSKFTCTAGGSFEESDFGCIDPETGDCIKPGKTVTKNCVEYKCDRATQSLKPVNTACKWENECKEVGSKWFDKESCCGYKCVFDPEDDDVKVVETTSGCSTDSGCVRSGRKKKGPGCVSYTCRNGRFRLASAGCKYGDICIDAGKEYNEDCTTIKCVIQSEGPSGVETALRIQHGCRGKDNKCYRVGEELCKGCKVFECFRGGNFKLVSSGCMNKYGKCVQKGELVQRQGSSYICGEKNKGNYQQVTNDEGCKGLSGKMYNVGYQYKDDCVVYECKKNGRNYLFKPVKYGCKFGGKCYDGDSAWFDGSKCGMYTCEIKSVGSSVTVKVAYTPGCKFNGKCKKKDDEWKAGCSTKKCAVINKKNGKQVIKIVTVKGACVETKAGGRKVCHEPGEKWMEYLNNMCIQKKCMKKKRGYKSKVLCKACMDSRGNCRSVGEGDFPAVIGGKKYKSCDCLKKGKGVRYRCD